MGLYSLIPVTTQDINVSAHNKNKSMYIDHVNEFSSSPSHLLLTLSMIEFKCPSCIEEALITMIQGLLHDFVFMKLREGEEEKDLFPYMRRLWICTKRAACYLHKNAYCKCFHIPGKCTLSICINPSIAFLIQRDIRFVIIYSRKGPKIGISIFRSY